MKLKNKYFILRHGQNIYQVKKKDFMYPRKEKTPIKLTKKGRAQIKKILPKIKKLKIDLIFSSDTFRTRQTAGMVAEEIGFKARTDKRLRDINWGIFMGCRKDYYYKNFFPKNSLKRFYKKPVKGESWLDCQKRSLSFIREIDRKYNNKNILIVSHGDTLWLMEGAVKNWSTTKLLKERQNNYIKVGELRQL